MKMIRKFKKLITLLVAISLLAGITVYSQPAKAAGDPLITADCSNVTKKVNHSLFGYILTPNYDVPQSRMSLLGPILNRETIPVQNFQAIGDMDGSYYQYENCVLERQLEAIKRARKAGLKYYFLMGHNPSWATASGGPVDSTKNQQLKNATQLAYFKQYCKDVFQYLRDNGEMPDFADLTNEYWTGTELTFKGVWEALREVYPEYVYAVGPGAVGYSGIPDYYIPFCEQNQLSLEGPSWHEFWINDKYVTYSRLKGWYDNIANIQKQHPDANGKYIIWEENNAGSQDACDWARSMSNVVRTGVDYNIKGCLESNNWNGMSDLLTTNVKAPNNSARRPIWWSYYTFAQLSGNYVQTDTQNSDESFTGAVSVDEHNIKVIIAKNGSAGSVSVNLKNAELDDNLEIDVYKIVNSENQGLAFNKTIDNYSYSNGTISFSTGYVNANEVLYIDIKDGGAKPGFILPLTPDDGQAVSGRPVLTWSRSVGADSYLLKVSEKEDLSDPIVNEENLTGTSYTINESLKQDKTYYWTVTAKNGNGTTPVINNTVYSFLYKSSSQVPGQFGPYLPSIDSHNEDVMTELKWSTAYNASSYHVVVSEKEDFSNPVVDVRNVTSVRGTGQFGNNSQGYYRFRQGELKNSTKYYWTVYAVNGSGERMMNGPLHWFYTKAAGDRPVDFELKSPENEAKDVPQRAVLEWDRSENAFFYELTISKNSDMSDPILVRPTMIYNRYTVEQNMLEPSETYYWTVKAYTKDRKLMKETESGVYSFTVRDTPCSPLIYAHVPGNHSVKLKYRKVDSCDGYCILYGTKPGVYTGLIDDVQDDVYTVENLKNGVTYYFSVVAYNDYGTSEIWNERPETPKSVNGTVEEDDTADLPVIDPQDVSNSHNIYYVPPTPTPTPEGHNETGDEKITEIRTDDGKIIYVNDKGEIISKPNGNENIIQVTAPGRVKIKKLSYKKGRLIVRWKKKKGAEGYAVHVYKNKKLKKPVKKAVIKKNSTVTKKIKIKKGKISVRVRAYVMSNGTKLYGKWSKTKRLK